MTTEVGANSGLERVRIEVRKVQQNGRANHYSHVNMGALMGGPLDTGHCCCHLGGGGGLKVEELQTA